MEHYWGQVKRRVKGLAMVSRGIVPELFVSRKVLDNMHLAAQQYLEDETGEAMVGMLVDADGKSRIYVIDTISPDVAYRSSHSFQQGSDWQGDVFLWLKENWDLYCQQGLDSEGQVITRPWLNPLIHLGDWHKQPGNMIAPSFGDLQTALSFLDDLADNQYVQDFLLVPILTLDQYQTENLQPEDEALESNYLLLEKDNFRAGRVDWWYIHRSARIFQPIIPQVMDELECPALPDYPWHLKDTAKYQSEIDALQNANLFAFLLTWQTGSKAPMDVVFAVVAESWRHVMIIITRPDYPASAPLVYRSTYQPVGEDVYAWFATIWQSAEALKIPSDWHWIEDKKLVDLIQHMEAHLGW